jgi:hypothetical protein
MRKQISGYVNWRATVTAKVPSCNRAAGAPSRRAAAGWPACRLLAARTPGLGATALCCRIAHQSAFCIRPA